MVTKFPRTPFAAQLAILAELRKQTSLLVEMNERAERKQNAKRAEKGVATTARIRRFEQLDRARELLSAQRPGGIPPRLR